MTPRIGRTTTTYADAMERSWPHGQYLLDLIKGVSKVHKESDSLKALRTAREKIEKQVAALETTRELLAKQLVSTCVHPVERLYVTEDVRRSFADISKVITTYRVVCGTCETELKIHQRKS